MATSDEKAIAITLGAKIRRERIEANLTQEKLAELADLNIRSLQKIEAGQINILVPTLIRIQAGIGCTWTKLLPE